ncbi:MAG: PQQ-dependent sugar dehydrogenase [Gammaproteobacteria bacterium]|nr:PQQ-dependent sugar dehydrogenase [Gammaproteobacteria bacterium]
MTERRAATARRAYAALTPLVAACASATAPEATMDPYSPIPQAEGTITVAIEDFAHLPDSDQGLGELIPARMMLLRDERGTGRLFVNDLNGLLYSITYDGKVTPYLELNAERWNLQLELAGRPKGFQSFAFHPQFADIGKPGHGRFYTLIDTKATAPTPDYLADPSLRAHDTVLLEWVAKDPSAAVYDGDEPRELLRVQQPHFAHNGGMLSFRPQATQQDADYGLLYMGIGDGGRGSDPQRLARNLGRIFGKILRIDPLGSNSVNGKYGIPDSNPFASDGSDATLGEIYASGLRNPQRMAWDSKTGAFFVLDIGQNVIEEISIVTPGADLGWSDWEGSFRHNRRKAKSDVLPAGPRSDSAVSFPFLEFDQLDPLLELNPHKKNLPVGNPPSAAITGIVIYRDGPLAKLADKLLFGDSPSGEVFYVAADEPPKDGWKPKHIRRVLFEREKRTMTLLEIIQETNVVQRRRRPNPRADLRFGTGPNGQVFLLNKADGVIRRLVPQVDESKG